MSKLHHHALTALLSLAMLASSLPAFAVTNLLKAQTYWNSTATTMQTRAGNMVTGDGWPNTSYCTSAINYSASAPAGSTSSFGYRCQQAGGVPSGHPECGSGVQWCYYEAYAYSSCPSADPVANYPVTNQCSAKSSTPGTTGAPTDYECSYYTGQTYKQFSAWDAPVKIVDCSPSACGLGSPSYDTSAQSFLVITYTYTGQNCADHSKTPTLTPDETAPVYTGTKQDSIVTNVIDNSTGAVTSTTTTTVSTTTSTQGGIDGAILDKLGDIDTGIAGIGSGSGASAGDIGDAVGDALKDPDEDSKPDVGDYTGDAEGIIGGMEGSMDDFADTVGEGLGTSTDDPGWSSTVGGLLPSYSCSDFSMTVHGITIDLKCSDTVLLRQILAFFFYAFTVAALFYLATERPTA